MGFISQEGVFPGAGMALVALGLDGLQEDAP